MKDDEIELVVQLLLESRTYAYIKWLENKLIMAANNNINKDSLLEIHYYIAKFINLFHTSRVLRNSLLLLLL